MDAARVPDPDDIDPERRRKLLVCVELLEAIAADRGLLACLDREERDRLMEALGRVGRPDRTARRRLRKERRLRAKEAARRADEASIERTGLRSQARRLVFPTPLPEVTDGGGTGSDEASGVAAAPPPLVEDRSCYICKADYRELHHFYDALCPPCAEHNWSKRQQTCDLRGRTALVTGARVKIGYQTAIKLLRAGARVIATTRFPRDAAARFCREPDFPEWGSRLAIHGLDLRHTPSVVALTRHVMATEERLDVLINNACQTVRRPPEYYRHLMEAERTVHRELPRAARPLLAGHEALRAAADGAVARAAPGLLGSAELSQLQLIEEDREAVGLFPQGELDADLQQVDLREVNSWRLRLDEVSAVELIEVHLVNAVAPFVLNGHLRPLMARVASRDKHIVNVSAMEGQFYRSFKTDRHPHTNMAKAALNMMTRTSAPDYLRDGIHMNSVDTGWITDEDPAVHAARKRQEHGFHPPLDHVDAAARILDPVFAGFLTGEHVWGQFLKDYQPVRW